MSVVTVLFTGFVASALAAANEPPCSASEYRQFDFRLGDWEAKNADGQLLGRISTGH